MGYYIDPSDGRTKEQWLKDEGVELPSCPSFNDLAAKNQRPVVLLQNPGFSAAGIAYDPSELRAFTGPNDFRPKRFFAVDVEKLRAVNPHFPV